MNMPLEFGKLKKGNLIRFLELAKSKKGCFYRWGGNGPDRFDCSGFVVWCLVMAGGPEWREGWWSQRLFDELPSTDKEQAGALAFYGKDDQHISHVMVCLGDGQVIGASGGNRMTINDDVARFRRAMVKVKPKVRYRVPDDFRGFRLLPLE